MKEEEVSDLSLFCGRQFVWELSPSLCVCSSLLHFVENQTASFHILDVKDSGLDLDLYFFLDVFSVPVLSTQSSFFQSFFPRLYKVNKSKYKLKK